MEHRQAKRANDRGYVLIGLAGMMIMLLGFAGLVFDVGYLEFQKRKIQAAADAGAIAGAHEIRAGGDVAAAATQAVQMNGFSVGKDGVTLTINRPPLTGSNMGNGNYVEVNVARTMPTAFLGALKRWTMKTSARSVAGPTPPRICVWVLNQTATAAMNVTGSADVSIGCGVLVNSSGNPAVNTGNAACLQMEYMGAVGPYSNEGRCALTSPPVTNIPRFSDPLAGLPAPAYGACDYSDFRSNSDQTINPGVYCGGMKINGGALRLNPGIYILNGGGLDINSSSAIIGEGVFFYNTAGAGQSFAPIKINGGAEISLAAATTGTYAGILFFQDRNVGAGETNLVLGNSTMKLEGTLYMPNSILKYSGNSEMTAYTPIIADRLQFSGSAVVRNDTSKLPDGPPVKLVGLVE